MQANLVSFSPPLPQNKQVRQLLEERFGFRRRLLSQSVLLLCSWRSNG
jgi:hypothetical protein